MDTETEYEKSVSGLVPVDYVRKINLPKIPENLLPDLEEWNYYEKLEKTGISKGMASASRYRYTYELLNHELNKWCQENVCDSALFQFVVSNGLDIHKDKSIDGKNFITTGRLVYPIVTGSSNATTCFWSPDKKTKIKEYILEPYNWYILASSNYHSVSNVPKDAYRLIVTSRFLHEKLAPEDIRL